MFRKKNLDVRHNNNNKHYVFNKITYNEDIYTRVELDFRKFSRFKSFLKGRLDSPCSWDHFEICVTCVGKSCPKSMMGGRGVGLCQKRKLFFQLYTTQQF